MLIRMKKTTPASRDGRIVEDFVDGCEYTMTTTHELRVAASLIKSGGAEEVEDAKVTAPVVANKATTPAGPFTLKSAGFGKFNIFDGDGNKVTEKVLTKAEAEAETKRLNG